MIAKNFLIQKREDGPFVPFNTVKIEKAILRAMSDVDGVDKEVAAKVALAVYEEYAVDIESGMEDVDYIDDLVEDYLIQYAAKDVVKAYIRKRDERAYDREHPWEDFDDRQNMILKEKYMIKGETKKDFINRISNGNHELKKIFRNQEAIWGGRNLFAIGRDGNITGSNCYVAPDPEDNLESIYHTDYVLARTYSYGGGQGLNASNLRWRGAKVNNASNTSPGPMIFIEKWSHTTLNTQQESRRGALMVTLNIGHPDIIDFITAKLDLTKINGANISITMSDEFMGAVKNGLEWTMEMETSHEKITRVVDARELMGIIAYCAHTMGDPGMLFIDTVNSYHLLSEYLEIYYTATNPCGEQPLEPHESCNLGSLNLARLVRNAFRNDVYIDYKRVGHVVDNTVWGLDDLLDLLGERHALPEQRQQVINYRGIGLGMMGYADLALMFKVAYGSPEFLEIIAELQHFIVNRAVQASALRAKEKGAFPMYREEDILNSSFMEVLTDETIAMVKKYGLRNSRLISIAPNGSTGNMYGVSQGREPYFRLTYWRKSVTMFKEETYIEVVEKTPQALMKYLGIDDLNELPKWATVTAANLTVEDSIKVQATLQKYVDTAISSTFNMVNEASTDDVIDVYMSAWESKLKGITVFRDNCKKIGILTEGDVEPDKHEATPPSITIKEILLDKHTGETKEYVKTITIDANLLIREDSKQVFEKCPICDSHLIKHAGCTKCSDPACLYEKCAL